MKANDITRDQARNLASDACELGESFEADIAHHRACEAAAVALRASRAALGSVRIAAFPVAPAVLVAAGEALDAAALLVGRVTEPFLSKTLADQQGEFSALLAASRETERRVGEAVWALVGAEGAIRRSAIRDAATALNAARALVKALGGIGGLAARLAAADTAYQARLGVRKAG